MPKIIVVAGTPDSGKTSAIRRFLAKKHIPYVKTDITVVIRVKSGVVDITVGVTSAGDKTVDLEANLEFLLGRKCDIIVCTARLGARNQSKTLDLVEEFALKHEFGVPIKIKTKKVPKANIQSENKQIAKEIWTHIP